MLPNASNSTATDLDLAVNDLGPLAWVLDELRKSLDGAAKALKRFVRDAEAGKGSDLAAIDASQLRVARQQLHQAVGALEMVGLAGPALVLRAMEAAVQKFVQQPENCTQEAAAKIERASFALTEYLEGVLADKPISAVSLFPQYREVQELVRADRVHPADLWPHEWRWLEPELTAVAGAQSYGDSVRSVFDQSTLQIMKGDAARAAAQLREVSLGLAAGQSERQPRIFWTIAAGYFEALAHGLMGSDVYVRRAASRVLLQYLSLSKGDPAISERLAQDLLFFCSQAVSQRASDTPVLSAVRAAYGLARFKPVDYEAVQFGRFDPALLAQARKRIVSAKETWSSLSAGDANKFKLAVDQFSLVSDSLVKLHPPSEQLAQALMRAIETTARSAQPPPIELAMEVATSVLYLEAAFDDLDPRDPQLAERTAHLAERLERVRSGGDAQPLESWMEELYRRVSDKQTMGSVVGELRVSLGELEKSLDLFFRNPQDKTVLREVPGKLSQMRGVLSVLGLEQASQAVLRMRDSVEQMLETEVDETLARAAGTFDQLGNNLGALSFLIDMLNYQPALAKKLFVYDDKNGELKPLMGRTHRQDDASGVTVNSAMLAQEAISLVQEADAGGSEAKLAGKLDALSIQAALAGRSDLARTAHDASVAVSGHDPAVTANALTSLASSVAPSVASLLNPVEVVDFEEDDLRDIFLDEAREATANGLEAVRSLEAEPGNIGHLTVLRRVFHTLKGSSRMVGLNEFGEAAWSMEQMFNSLLADQKSASDEFRNLSAAALAGFSAWIEDIAADQDAAWSASAFRVCADAMRLDGRLLALTVPARPETQPLLTAATELQVADPLAGLSVAAKLPESDTPVAREELEEVLDFDVMFDIDPSTFAPVETTPDTSAYAANAAMEIQGIDFDSLSGLSGLPDGNELAEIENRAISELPPAFEAAEQTETVETVEIADTADRVELSAADFDAQFLETTRVLPVETVLTVSDLALPEVTLDNVTLLVSEKASEPAISMDLSDKDLSAGEDADEGSVRVDSYDSSSSSDGSADEQVKVIGSLRIGIPLYNVYLNEADEWSRRLVTELSEWAIEGHGAIHDSTLALAHSLAGSSATVGFDALSDIARALEHVLQQSQVHHVESASAGYAGLFVDAAEDIRRLLHQFAAGFLKEPDAKLLERLRQLEFPEAVSLSPTDDEGLDFPAEEPAQEAVNHAELSVIPDPAPGEVPIVASPLELTGVDVARLETAPESAKPVLLKVDVPAYVRQPVMPVSSSSFIATPAATFSDDEDDEIDAVDAIDEELFPIFEEEGAELMPQLGGALRQWSVRPDNQSARMEVLRALHTLKGSARLAGAMRLGEMAHRIESEIEYLGSESIAAQDFEPLLARFDAMAQTFETLRASDLQALVSPATVAAEPVLSPMPELSVQPQGVAAAELEVTPGTVSSSAGKVMIPAPQLMSMQPLRQAASASIRVRSQLLDRMVNQAGEVMITRSRLEVELGQLRGSLSDMSDNLNRLRQQLRDIEVQAESQMQSRLAQAKEAQAGFDPLEFDRFTRVQELTRMMAESVNDVATVQRTLQRTVEATEDDLIAQARQTRELQRDLLRTRMVEFEGISDRLYRVVRQASKETGKQVKLDLLGGTIEMDRGMLDRMTPAFEHLLRNCVAHGIESPEVRSAAGKDAVGLITVNLRQDGNDVSVDFSDDGAGLNLQRIREKAVALGLVAADQALPDADAANLIFLPGFSTASQVTELSGRGIGMDVVRSEVNAVGGRIETSTVAGQGTHFKLVLPLTTAVTQVVMVRAGNLSVGVPANVVETVRRATAKELQQSYNTGLFDVAGELVPFFWSGALLQASRRSGEVQGKTTPVVVFRSAAQRIALHVDEVLGNREVVVKNLGPQLSRLPGLAGMSVLASGAVVLIYNPVALATIYGQQARALSADSAEPHALESQTAEEPARITQALAVAPAQVPLILVVDDSITVRRVTQRLLQREGYRVAMAADGLQALERLQEERPTVVLSDIEMPRMDGFDLARNIRADPRLSDLPIVMITSRIAEKHREHAKELGVDHYLGKPYSEDELMSLVRRYCNAAVAA